MMAAFDARRWSELRDKRKRGEKLDRDERDEWRELDAERGLVRARERRAKAREMSRRRLNSIRMELGTIAVDAGLRDVPRDRIRQALENLARELGSEADRDAGAPGGTRPVEAPAPDSPHGRILAAVAAIPEGAVMTYGRVADRASLPGQGQTVGDALARHPDAAGWHRVVNAEGRILTPPERGQRTLLEAEGVEFVLDRIDLHRFAPHGGA
ncbi:MAG: MGMT family protein [Alphaproteobacteria bacterium]|nr:MGMT family protein [Alphaproteobacteria bacterium]